MTELLAPAGNFEKLKTAVRYGADAVYLAGYRFSLRSGSDNFNANELKDAVAYAHANRCRVYCALNAFLTDADIAEFVPYVQMLETIGMDAVIVSDIGMASIIAQETGLRIHVSTQASVTNSEAAEIWKHIGAKRVVLAREVTLDEASAIKKRTGLEVEVFVHGAMCMSYSGHCTISNYTAGRDSNRGGCIQSCRHGYEHQDATDGDIDYLMGSKDMNSVALIEKMYRLGIDSLKIEGRMKSLLYVATATGTYADCLQALKQKRPLNLSAAEDELRKMPYRMYHSGSHATKADWTSVHRNRPVKTEPYRMAGYVMAGSPPGYSLFCSVTSIDPESTLEFLDTAGKTVTLGYDQLQSLNGEQANRLRPNRLYLIPECIPAYTVARIASVQAPPFEFKRAVPKPA